MRRENFFIGERLSCEEGRGRKMVVENAGIFLDRVMEIGKALPRVVVGLVMSKSMRVVRAGDSIGNDSLIALTIAWIGIIFLFTGFILSLIGLNFYGCEKADRMTAFIEQGLADANEYRRGYCLVKWGRLTFIIGGIIGSVGILMLARIQS